MESNIGLLTVLLAYLSLNKEDKTNFYNPILPHTKEPNSVKKCNSCGKPRDNKTKFCNACTEKYNKRKRK